MLGRFARRVDCHNNLGGHLGHGLHSMRLDDKIARCRLIPCLHADAKTSEGCTIPQIPLLFWKGMDEFTKCPYRGIHALGHLGDFEVRTILSTVASYVEGNHSPAETNDERPEIICRIDIKIDVQKMCS